MPRPVEGFTTKDGHFFEDEQEARVHEVVYIMSMKFNNQIKDHSTLADVPSDILNRLFLDGLQFVLENRNEIQIYLEATAIIEGRNAQAEPPTEGVTGEASEPISTPRRSSKRVPGLLQ